ncbi:bifunctional (p)ppGpp synthetase/guanosine-3',5'-bis(diphosphate) 3'-pyrophosphohydrolase [Leptospira selangorensis]|uniref:Bifunctional (P)ppGpp synthetase/guanosine-3',5'-bis(Diphosphate) 3'-pyrophosphohydrolase n=1 Tax=Leptospira selangorensis TaxID=2484982 RepID=A0A4R9G374_9LEPT|nr:bifunctional (p)ppGpp synthetase/guanosine-3',5'-bis(diphosphate) 3'-pyrophosphohydrolase [Leptospira selangorensis]TGK05794.1 bifunctional (p)ppGpp synthetase/guanosine-3',5'-bis(diphosphate) 3'-pyrophosphohydrolase [Leptospira selangorensis]TGM12408.1 bifunctional (p)ppGpp synthetase/guanosine-3',5'-bis(diphosphate) 3'-pyrophosphohydrolase [Leptospira selangorensis]TGM14549.1 bifunctional (p)ppGpp synthetase/guanosine-3',5'-bis(diphosphate) 3'-pyrophosphohydrolase [Leptospira selangorensis]
MGFVKAPATKEMLIEGVRETMGPEALEMIEKAYKVSEDSHQGQFRLSGEPYIVHPLQVGFILYELGLDEKVISAGILHDVIEDTKYTRDDMVRDFGTEITQLVEGVTKISQIKSQSKETEAAENIRKIIIATIQDIRVILIKLADKTHNMRTLSFQPPEKQRRIANETLSLYAPIAGRLGIYSVKSELEDLAFQVIFPEEYQDIKKRISAKKSEREDYIEKLQLILKQRLAEIQINANVEGRAKHFFSIYRKMKTKEKTFDEIFDLRAIRIVTDEIKDCYGVLGIVHTLWSPVPGRFKDYIATPKTNMYQSLHTTVIGPDGKPLEVQIRTAEMNAIAEFGIAAHWVYKEGKTHANERHLTVKWLEVLQTWQDSSLDPKEFLEELKYDLHEDEVFVFTPKGEIIQLPKGATVLDFAFRIHTDVGLHCKGAKINGRMIPLRTELRSGDQVEVVVDKRSKPSPIWLRIVKTPSARQKLRAYFRKLREETSKDLAQGAESAAELTLNAEVLEELKRKPSEKVSKQTQVQGQVAGGKILVAGLRDIPVRLSGCCSPLPGDQIIGFVTRGRGVSVHKKNCSVALKQREEEQLRQITVDWDYGQTEPVPVRVEVKAKDRQGIYLEMVKSISGTQTNILEAGASTVQKDTLMARFMIEVEHLDQLKEILGNLKRIPDVVFAHRVK